VSFTVFLSLLMATFGCIGFVLAIVMGRLGHSPFAWGVLGLPSARPGRADGHSRAGAALGPASRNPGPNRRRGWLRLAGGRRQGAGLSSVLLGSVATRLAARASVPVLVMGDRVRDGWDERRLHRVDRAEPRR
jgi:hypothetical protein